MTAKRKNLALEGNLRRSTRRRQRAAIHEFSPNRGLILVSERGVTARCGAQRF